MEENTEEVSEYEFQTEWNDPFNKREPKWWKLLIPLIGLLAILIIAAANHV